MPSLWEACRLGDMEEVVAALARGEDVNSVQESQDKARGLPPMGVSCLMIALDHALTSRGLQVAHHLLDQPGIDVAWRTEDNCTALHWACDDGYVEIVRRLVAVAGLPLEGPEAEADCGLTPLGLAIENQSTKVIKLLVGKGIDLWATDHSGTSLEEYAEENMGEGLQDFLNTLKEARKAQEDKEDEEDSEDEEDEEDNEDQEDSEDKKDKEAEKEKGEGRESTAKKPRLESQDN